MTDKEYSSVCVTVPQGYNASHLSYYDLLMALYSTERKFLDSRRSIGIAQSAKNGNYKGRTKIKIDKLAAQEIFLDYQAKKINSTEAARKLGISNSTFLRRYRGYANMRQ